MSQKLLNLPLIYHFKEKVSIKKTQKKDPSVLFQYHTGMWVYLHSFYQARAREGR